MGDLLPTNNIGDCKYTVPIMLDSKISCARTSWRVSTDFLIERIREAGIISLGGAGFPTHIKLSPPHDKPIKHLVINACESDLYATCDERLIVEKTSNILNGVKVMRKVLCARAEH